MGDNDAEDVAPAERRLATLRALLARLDAEGRPDDPAIRAVRSLLDDAARDEANDPDAS